MNENNKFTILDHIDDIRIPGDVFREPSNEYWALICLKKGLEFLYQQAARLDAITQLKLNPTDNMKVSAFGNFPGTEAIPKALLTCSFHWYAISACQYVRTVGAIACMHDSNRPIPIEYVQAVIPEVLAFRNKVAAHFSWSTKHSQDNDAERLASIIPPLTFIDDSWNVGALEVAISKKGKTLTSAAVEPWSISKVHLKLARRYWPEQLNNKSIT